MAWSRYMELGAYVPVANSCSFEFARTACVKAITAHCGAWPPFFHKHTSALHYDQIYHYTTIGLNSTIYWEPFTRAQCRSSAPFPPSGLDSVKRCIYSRSFPNVPVKLPDSFDATVEASSPSRWMRSPLSYRTDKALIHRAKRLRPSPVASERLAAVAEHKRDKTRASNHSAKGRSFGLLERRKKIRKLSDACMCFDSPH